jgi:putative membrane protein
MMFFIGMIVGIAPLIYLKVKNPGHVLTVKQFALILIPAMVVAGISVLASHFGRPDTAASAITVTAPYMLLLLFAGFVAAAALIIPGVSGSFALLLMGVYPAAINAVSSLRDYAVNPADTALLLDICKVLGPLGIGILIGGITTARLVEQLLKKHEKTMYTIILGLITGSVYALFSDPVMFQSEMTPFTVPIGIAAFILGGTASFMIGRKKI